MSRRQPVALFEHARIHNEGYGTTPDMIYDFMGDCGMQIWDLALSRVFSRDAFSEIYESSFASNYDRNAQTNFVACARDTDWAKYRYTNGDAGDEKSGSG